MDIFVEQLFLKRNSVIETIVRIMGVIILGLLAGVSLIATLFNLLGLFSSLGILAAAGSGFAAWYFNGMFYNEFEYILTNGEFDIDKICNKNKRKRLVSFECKNIERIYRFDSNCSLDSNSVFAANIDAENLYCIEVAVKGGGKTTIVIEPNEKMIQGMKKCISRQVLRDVSDWN